MSVIAVDGPAASGKGTISARVAAHYGFHYLDTGALYRAVAARVLDSGADPADAAAAAREARALTPDDLDRHDLRQAPVASGASIVAANPDVRAALVDFQRSFAARAPGAVLDGRDIGTVICPDAPAKLYVTADLETRAARRWNQRVARGETVTLEDVMADIRTRDARDAGRADAPMRQAQDAALLDTTNLSIEQAVESAFALIESRLNRSG